MKEMNTTVISKSQEGIFIYLNRIAKGMMFALFVSLLTSTVYASSLRDSAGHLHSSAFTDETAALVDKAEDVEKGLFHMWARGTEVVDDVQIDEVDVSGILIIYGIDPETDGWRMLKDKQVEERARFGLELVRRDLAEDVAALEAVNARLSSDDLGSEERQRLLSEREALLERAQRHLVYERVLTEVAFGFGHPLLQCPGSVSIAPFGMVCV